MTRNGVENRAIGVKFGGTSMANAERVRRARGIILSNPDRTLITVSAPGNGDKHDPMQNFRVTVAQQRGEFDLTAMRFDQMAGDLFGRQDERYKRLQRKIEQTRRKMQAEGIGAYSESRGEDLMGRIMAELLDATYLDPQKYLLLNSDGTIHPDTYGRIRGAVGRGRYVWGGYFGANVDTGEIQLLPPGGTDYTMALVTGAVGARVYENYTDVKGVLAADPRLFPKKRRADIKGVREITFDEMGELSYRGAGILQVDAVAPARAAGIPINIRSSFYPEHPGTMVVENRISHDDNGVIAIASKKGFVSIRVTQAGMNKRKGIMARLGEVFEANDVSLEQGPGGNDYMSVIFHQDQLTNGTGRKVMRDIRAQIPDSSLVVVDRRGLVSLVGKSLEDESTATSVNADVFTALRDARIGHGAHIQAERPISSVISVRNDDTKRAVRVLYDALIK